MKTLRAGQTLNWRQCGWLKREWELYREADGTRDSLAWLRQPSLMSSDAEIRWSENAIAAPFLTLRVRGFLNQRLELVSADSTLPLPSESKSSRSGGLTLTLADGRVVIWQPTNFWRTVWELREEAGPPVMQARSLSWKRGGSLTLTADHLPQAELWLLVGVCWYQMILQMQRAAAAAAGGGA